MYGGHFKHSKSMTDVQTACIPHDHLARHVHLDTAKGLSGMAGQDVAVEIEMYENQ